MNQYDVVVIGGGAAGLFCAATAGAKGKRVALIEHGEKVGRKIEISGGGRCNFTNTEAGPGNYLSKNPDFPKSALARYSPWDFIALVESHGIAYHEKKLGQQFCDGSSRQIIRMLEDECLKAGVRLFTNCAVKDVQKPMRFVIDTSAGTFAADALVVATGGLSFPKLGATPFGYDLARRFGLALVEPQPGLVPLAHGANALADWNDLSGVSLPVVARCGGAAFEENMLFTHRGVSGPAILQISSFWRKGDAIVLDLLPGKDPMAVLEPHRQSGMDLATVMLGHWPKRFAERWCAVQKLEKPLGRFKKTEIEHTSKLMREWALPFHSSEGYAKAEVTTGGVDTSELSSRTMESRKVPGLYFIGEVVDVTGWLGGYNFQWAWASAHAAGTALGATGS